jgi:GPI ethanolamine phosphate transferase 2/3 subunit F
LGAPALDNYNETFSLAALMTIFTLLPFVLFVGVDGTVSTMFTDGSDGQSSMASSYLGLLKSNAIWVIVGAWSGSILGELMKHKKAADRFLMTNFPAPLDWERPWQIYPIPNICGAVLGHAFGNLYGLGRLWWTRKSAAKSN